MNIEKDSFKLESFQQESERAKFMIYKIKEKKVNDQLSLRPNSKLTTTQKKVKDGVEYKVEWDSLYTDSYQKNFSKKKKIVEPLCLSKDKYKANLLVSGDSLLINFWLFTNKEGTPFYSLTKEEQKAVPYNPQTKYFSILKNRQYQSFAFNNWEVSVLTIPFKYHFGYSVDSIEIDPNFSTNVNLSGFIGRRSGRVRYSYDSYKKMIESEWSATYGVTVGITSQKLDSISTANSKESLNREVTVPILSIGAGVVFNIKDFNIGIYGGIDEGVGKLAQKWNFDDRFWIGFGFGYKLAFLGKTE